MKKLLFILAGRFACRYTRVTGWLPTVLAHIVRPSVRTAASLHRLADLGLDDGDVFARTVIGAGGGRLYLLDHIEALCHLAKHGVLSVEMGSAAKGAVSRGLLLGKTYRVGLAAVLGFLNQTLLKVLQSGAVAVAAHIHNLVLMGGHKVVEGDGHLVLLHLLLHLLELGRLVDRAPDDVELAAARLATGIDLVTKSGSAERTTLMEETGIDFGFDGIAWAAHTEAFASWSALGVGVSALNHKVLDDTVEQEAVVIALGGELEEIVAVEGRLVIQADYDVAQSGCDFYC